MALSGSYDFTVNRDQIIKSSLRLIGVGISGENPTAAEINDASEALNIMVKAWAADGLHLWKRRTSSLTLVSGQSTYTLGPTGNLAIQRPLRLLEVVRRDSSNIDVPLNNISKEEYWRLSDKTSTGVPVSYQYDPQLSNGDFVIWPTPDATVAAGYTIQITYSEQLQDMDNPTDDVDFPAEWLEAIKYGLALRLAPEYGVSPAERSYLRNEFEAIYEKAKSFDQEYVSVYLQPYFRGQR